MIRPGAPGPQSWRGRALEQLHRQGSRLLPALAGVLDDQGPMPVHDLRVALRRSRALLALHEPALGQGTCRDVRGILGTSAGVLGPLRDLDVLRGRVASHLDALAARPSVRAPLLSLLEVVRVQARHGAVTHLVSGAFQACLPLLTGERPWPGVGPRAVEDLALAAPRLLWEVARPLHRLRRCAAGDLGEGELHALRLNLKRLRYTLEALQPVLALDQGGARVVLMGLQDSLGHLQDLASGMACLQRLGRDLEGAARRGLKVLLAEDRRLQALERAAFGELWNGLQGFWVTFRPET